MIINTKNPNNWTQATHSNFLGRINLGYGPANVTHHHQTNVTPTTGDNSQTLVAMTTSCPIERKISRHLVTGLEDRNVNETAENRGTQEGQSRQTIRTSRLTADTLLSTMRYTRRWRLRDTCRLAWRLWKDLRRKTASCRTAETWGRSRGHVLGLPRLRRGFRQRSWWNPCGVGRGASDKRSPRNTTHGQLQWFRYSPKRGRIVLYFHSLVGNIVDRT